MIRRDRWKGVVWFGLGRNYSGTGGGVAILFGVGYDDDEVVWCFLRSKKVSEARGWTACV